MTRLDARLTQDKFGIAAGPNPESHSLDVNQTSDPDGLTLSPPAQIIVIEPWMNVDSIGSGRTVEQDLTQIGGAYTTTLPVRYFRNVWFDYLEANLVEHWTLSGNSVFPLGTLLAGTEVRGRYVVR